VDAEHSRKNKNCGVLIFESVRVGHEDWGSRYIRNVGSLSICL
jgi:hypothetical protein